MNTIAFILVRLIFNTRKFLSGIFNCNTPVNKFCTSVFHGCLIGMSKLVHIILADRISFQQFEFSAA